jgi:hypothetical protein
MAAGTHGVIRTAHAVRALRDEVTAARVDELAMALAYCAARYRTVGGAPASNPAIASIPGRRTRSASMAICRISAKRSGGHRRIDTRTTGFMHRILFVVRALDSSNGPIPSQAHQGSTSVMGCSITFVARNGVAGVLKEIFCVAIRFRPSKRPWCIRNRSGYSANPVRVNLRASLHHISNKGAPQWLGW